MHRFACLILFLAPTVYANDTYYDYARVVNAEPITVSERTPVRKKVCEKPADVSPPGDARRQQPQASIGDLIRADSRQRIAQCRTVDDYEQREKTVGWRVTYRYAGKNYVRRMKEKPGERIRVRIEIEAGSPSGQQQTVGITGESRT